MRPRALVTGASARVGRAIALELARSGFDLAIHHRSHPDDAEQVLAACRDLGADGFLVAADLATVAGCDGLVAAVEARWDQLHVLVNNASVFAPTPFDGVDAGTWDDVLAINVRAPFLLSRGLLSAMRRADGRAIGAPDGQHAVVVHLVDIGSERPVSGYAPYSVSKAALAMLVKAMAVELAPAIRTLGVSPGQVAWPEDYDADKRARLARRIPVGRVGAPEDVATLVRYLVCEGHYLNGAIIPVDGGLGVRY